MHYIYCRHEYCNNDETLWLFSSRSAHRPFCFHMNKCTSSRSTIIMNSFPNNIWNSIILCCGKFVHPGSTVVCPCCVTHEMVARWPSSSQSMRCHDKWSLKVGKGWKLLCGKSRLPNRNSAACYESAVLCMVGHHQGAESPHEYEDRDFFTWWLLASFSV
jgi:hypothetical protein